MRINTILKIGASHFVAIMIALLFGFLGKEGFSIMMLGMVVWTPFVLVVSLINVALLVVGYYFFKKTSSVWVASILGSMLLMVWYLLSSSTRLDDKIIQFVLFFFVLNLATIYFVERKNEKE